MAEIQRPNARHNYAITPKGMAMIAKMKLSGTVPVQEVQEPVPDKFLSAESSVRVDVTNLMKEYNTLTKYRAL